MGHTFGPEIYPFSGTPDYTVAASWRCWWSGAALGQAPSERGATEPAMGGQVSAGLWAAQNANPGDHAVRLTKPTAVTGSAGRAVFSACLAEDDAASNRTTVVSLLH
jgi:hypothetical protein